MDTALGYWSIPLAVVAGAIRVSTPFLFVSLGECLTEKSGRVNLGLEGTLVMGGGGGGGAMAGYGVSYLSGSAWLGVLAAAAIGGNPFGLLHGYCAAENRVNDIAVGIALMLLGVGLAFFLGKPLIQPSAPCDSPRCSLGFGSDTPQVRSALQVNVLFLIGLALAPRSAGRLKNTRYGLELRTVGRARCGARMGYDVNRGA